MRVSFSCIFLNASIGWINYQRSYQDNWGAVRLVSRRTNVCPYHTNSDVASPRPCLSVRSFFCLFALTLGTGFFLLNRSFSFPHLPIDCLCTVFFVLGWLFVVNCKSISSMLGAPVQRITANISLAKNAFKHSEDHLQKFKLLLEFSQTSISRVFLKDWKDVAWSD